MDEAERVGADAVRARKMTAARFQQIERADDIGVDEVGRRLDRTVDMGFGRQVNHGVRVEIGKHAIDRRAIANVRLHETVAVVAGDLAQRIEIAGISELVDVADVVLGLADQESADGRTDETCPSGHDDAHIISGPMIGRSYQKYAGDSARRGCCRSRSDRMRLPLPERPCDREVGVVPCDAALAGGIDRAR